MVNLFIFRRDLRIYDNTAFINAIRNSDKVACIFIFTPEQVDSNRFFSENAFQFMCESLLDLNQKLKNKLSFFYGDNISILNDIYDKTNNIKGIYYNKDYTPYAIERDQLIKQWCLHRDITLHEYEDYTLHPLDTIKSNKDEVYKIFTPFYKKAIKNHKVDKPKHMKNFIGRLITIDSKLSKEDVTKMYINNPHIIKHGKRNHGKVILKKIKNKSFKNYSVSRNYPINNTTILSPYIKFGLLSIREVFWTIIKTHDKNHGLIRELYWREFYAYIVYYNAKVLKGDTFNDDREPLWKNPIQFDKWCKGETGFPIVDAGMRQLNTIGWMHNRLRMIVANFLVKDMHIDWRLGERYFAQKLVDYDPCSNNGGWQWCAGTGADSQPYFRTFNPWLQTKRFDKECKYIKKWIPELRDVDNAIILSWESLNEQYDNVYIKPILCHTNQIRIFKKLFKTK